jgi:cold-inducible RNA-binding protein
LNDLLCILVLFCILRVKNMTNKIYVGNLSYRTSEDQLAENFSKFGKISGTVVVIDRATNRSKGFGFITFESDNSAQQAVQEMNGKELDGRTIKVSIAKPPKEREMGGGGGRGGSRSGGFGGGGRREGGAGGRGGNGGGRGGY